MNIGVDAGCLGIKDKRLAGGVYQLTLNLLKELKKIDKKNNYWLYSFFPLEDRLMREFSPKAKNLVVGPILAWNHFGLPLSLLFKKPDVFLGPNQSLPVYCPCPSIIIVHDLAFERFPHCYPDSFNKLSHNTKFAVKKAKKIIAVSQSTKNDLVNLYRVPAEKVIVVYEGYEKNIFRPTKKRINKKNYFLFVGALKRIRNVPGLIRGFKYFLDKSGQDFRLLLVGSDYWLDPQIKKTIKELSLNDKIKIKGFVNQAELVKLYRETTAFVSPSFCEGFGIPLVEAAACGCPVIAGNVGSPSEVIGEAGILVDPQKNEEIGEAMIRVVQNRSLRQRMIKGGLKRTNLFSWDKFAKQIFNIINEVEKSPTKGWSASGRKIACILLNYNGEKMILKCLESLNQAEKDDLKLEAIIVDNASKDGSLNKIKTSNLKNLKISKIIENKKNLGFAAGCNLGIKYALGRGAERILLLNQDTLVEKNFLNPLIKNSADLVSPVIKFPKKNKMFYDHGGKINWLLGRTTHLECSNVQMFECSKIDYVSGCAMFIKTEVFKKIGLFNEKYFLYFEDVDFCLRARKAGFNLAVEPKSLVFHRLVETNEKPFWQRTELMKSHLKFINDHISFLCRPIAYLYWLMVLIKVFLN